MSRVGRGYKVCVGGGARGVKDRVSQFGPAVRR